MMRYTISTATWKTVERQLLQMVDERFTDSSNNRMTAQANRHLASSHASERGKIVARSLLTGILLTFLLTCIELGLFWIINPNHVLGNGVAHQFSQLLALPVHTPLLW